MNRCKKLLFFWSWVYISICRLCVDVLSLFNSLPHHPPTTPAMLLYFLPAKSRKKVGVWNNTQFVVHADLVCDVTYTAHGLSKLRCNVNTVVVLMDIAFYQTGLYVDCRIAMGLLFHSFCWGLWCSLRLGPPSVCTLIYTQAVQTCTVSLIPPVY